MTAGDLVKAVRAVGGTIRAEGGKLKLTAPAPLPTDLIAQIRAHKPGLLEALRDDRPLSAKLRDYGQPWPLTVNGEVKCWLVPNATAAKGFAATEPVYIAREVEHLATLPRADILNLHELKRAFGGTVLSPKRKRDVVRV